MQITCCHKGPRGHSSQARCACFIYVYANCRTYGAKEYNAMVSLLSIWSSVETINADGSVVKTAIFKHIGYIEA